MHDLIGKINHLTWLKTMGIEYYFTEKPRDDSDKNMKHEISNTIKNKELKTIIESKPQDLHGDPARIEKYRASDSFSGLPPEPRGSRAMMFDLPVTQSPLSKDNTSINIARKLADSASTLAELKEHVINFEGCELKQFASNTVFADGDPAHAEIMFIGEAPGANEDAQGIPFCGESGKLLDNMLKSINISRESNAYITNTIFWRPPANRTPTQGEIDICRPFVEKHIALINPKIIVLVGATAVTSLFGKHSGITKIRQEYYSYQNKYLQKAIPATSIFHPAYLLRQPMQKKTTWYDLLKLKQFIVENSINS